MTWVQTVSQALLALRAEYAAEVERLAGELRPRFESGELHGWYFDGDGEEDGPHPVEVLEEELVENAQDFPAAYLVLACSPAEEGIDGDMGLASAKHAALECLVLDVYRFARSRAWWKPRPGEYVGDDEWRALEAGVVPEPPTRPAEHTG